MLRSMAPTDVSSKEIYLARFINTEQDLVPTLVGSLDQLDYARRLTEWLSNPQSLAETVILHLDGMGKDVRIRRDDHGYVTINPRNSPYLSTTRHVYSLRSAVEFNQTYGDVLFDIVNSAQKIAFLRIPRELVFNVAIKPHYTEEGSEFRLLESVSSKQDRARVIKKMFFPPVGSDDFVEVLDAFYQGNIQAQIAYYRYLSRCAESLCLYTEDFSQFVTSVADNPFRGNLNPVFHRNGMIYRPPGD
ncbi:MAG: hypothetical protein D6763_09900 [Alphaproteobacteria bacterium]|nr:MAG: hypothetical protein D6763_09900 [Alphaproteobacteria bacterium]